MCKNTLETGGEDVFFQILITLGFGRNQMLPWVLYNGKVDLRMKVFSTRFECSYGSSPLVPSVVTGLLHSFRV